MKKSALVLFASILAAIAVVGCSSAAKNETVAETAPVIEQTVAQSPVDLGASSSGVSH
jgi:outer membrane murein-binding lipoprotein Lpp